MKLQSGVSLFLAIIIMTILLAIALGLSTIFLGQVVLFGEMGYSVIAFYAADAGIEKVLVDWQNPNLTPDHYSGYLDLNNNGAQDNDDSSYKVVITPNANDPKCPNYCIKSIGTYKRVKRAIEVTY